MLVAIEQSFTINTAMPYALGAGPSQSVCPPLLFAPNSCVYSDGSSGYLVGVYNVYDEACLAVGTVGIASAAAATE